VLVTPNVLLFENTPERNAAVCRTPTGDARGKALSQPPENPSGGTPVVSPRFPDGNLDSIAIATHTTDARLSSLNGPRSLNDEIIASPSSKSETPKLTINTTRVRRANPIRHPRYRSQRDTIIAHLRGSSVTTPGRLSSTQSLLARMTGQTVAELDDVSGDDDDDADVVAKRKDGTLCGEGHVHFASTIRTAERSSGLFDSDDPPGGPKRRCPEEERTVTKADAQGMITDHLPDNAGANNVNSYFISSSLATEEPLSGPPTPTSPCSSIVASSHAHSPDRPYDDDDEMEKKATATATEARLRTQVRLRVRLAAERRLANDNV
jgi:hypothetical protein